MFVCLVCIALPLALLALGAFSWTMLKRYQPSGTGKLLDIYIKAQKDGFGDRSFKLVEKYAVEGRGFNCTIYNVYDSREEAEKQLERHSIGHQYLKLRLHDYKCITNSAELTYKTEAISYFSWS